jgi:hypothetical protein
MSVVQGEFHLCKPGRSDHFALFLIAACARQYWAAMQKGLEFALVGQTSSL